MSQLVPTVDEAGGNVQVREITAHALQTTHDAAQIERCEAAMADLAAAQAQWGCLSDALETAARITRVSPRDQALNAIVRVQAETMFGSEAQTTAQRIYWEHVRAHALASVAVAQMKTGASEAARATLALAVEVVQTLPDFETRAIRLTDLMSLFADARLFDLAREIVDRIEEPWRKTKALGALATAQAQAEELASAQRSFMAAVEAALELEPAWVKADALLEIAHCQIEAGEVEAVHSTLALARESALRIEEVGQRDDPLEQIARSQAKAGEVPAARETAGFIEDTGSRAGALASASAAAARQGDVPAARSLLLEAQALLIQGDPPEGALLEIALAQVSLGQLAAAAETAEQIRGKYSRDLALATLAVEQAQRGDLAAAAETVRSLQDTADQLELVESVGSALIAGGERETARRILIDAARVAQKSQASWKEEALKLLGVLLARLGWGRDAVGIAGEIRTKRGPNWSEIAAALIDGGDRESFKRMLLMSADVPDTALQLCVLLSQLYPEQQAEVAAVLRAEGNVTSAIHESPRMS